MVVFFPEEMDKMPHYEPCPEFDKCNELIERHFQTGQYEACFAGHLELAEKGYPLAECQVGYFYHEGLGTPVDLEQSFYWTQRAALHGDVDAQFNLAEWFYVPGVVVEKDLDKAAEWLRKVAAQGDPDGARRLRELGYSET